MKILYILSQYRVCERILPTIPVLKEEFDLDTLKIDVEGYELNVLNGSINTIKNQVKFILIEKQFFNQYQGVSHKKVEMLLKKHNFKLIKKFTYPLFHYQDNLYKKV